MSEKIKLEPREAADIAVALERLNASKRVFETLSSRTVTSRGLSLDDWMLDLSVYELKKRNGDGEQTQNVDD